MFPDLILSKFEVFDWRNAAAILRTVHSGEWADLMDVLSEFRLNRSFVEVGGGNKSAVARGLDQAFAGRGWVEKAFDTKVMLDGVSFDTPTHAIDCYKNRVALEVEWNNKDPFFDRDLNNFRLLYDLRAIDLGIVVTRTTRLETVLRSIGRASTTFGKATTHTEKLYPKIKGGGAGGCPVLVFGIKPEAYDGDA